MTTTGKSAVNQEGLLTLEQPLLRVPQEQLKRAIKYSQKLLEKDLLNLVSTLEKAPQDNVRSLEQKLQSIKKKVPFLILII
jgi:hypothetical protein